MYSVSSMSNYIIIQSYLQLSKTSSKVRENQMCNSKRCWPASSNAHYELSHCCLNRIFLNQRRLSSDCWCEGWVDPSLVTQHSSLCGSAAKSNKYGILIIVGLRQVCEKSTVCLQKDLFLGLMFHLKMAVS